MFEIFKIFLALYTIGTSISATVKLKGGLIYKHEGVAQINQDVLTYKRTMDSSALYSVAKRLQDSTQLYKQYCALLSNFNKKGQLQIENEHYNKAMKENITVRYISTPLKYQLKDTTSVCARLDARRVEIRDIFTYNAARTYASQHNIDQFEAGIQYNLQTKRFQFLTDGYPAKIPKLFSHIVYGGYYTGKQHLADWEQDSYVVTDANKYPFIYSKPTGNFVLRLADDDDRNRLDYIMCEQTVTQPLETTDVRNPFVEIAAHSCKRDYTALSTRTKYTIQEIYAVTNLNFTISEEPQWTDFFPHFEPLNNKEQAQTFWYNLANQNVPKPTLGNNVPNDWYDNNQDSEDHPYYRKKRALFIPTYLPFGTNTGYVPHPSSNCYKVPSRPFSEDSSHFFHFPYEEWEIFADTPRTLPDYVLLMHTIWKIHVETQFNKNSFPEWMRQLGLRLPLFQLLRRSEMVKRVERNLDMSYERTRNLFLSYLRSNRKNPSDFDFRIQRNLEYLQYEIMDKFIEFSLENFNITSLNNETLTEEEIITLSKALLSQNSDYAEEIQEGIEDDDSAEDDEEEQDKNNEDQDLQQPRRVKRIAPLIGAGIAGLAVGSAATILAQHYQPSNLASMDEAHVRVLRQLATEIKSLKINSQQATNVLNNVVDKLQNFEMQILGNFEGVTSITMAQDLSGLNEQLQTISQLTILKYNAALLAAARHTPTHQT